MKTKRLIGFKEVFMRLTLCSMLCALCVVLSASVSYSADRLLVKDSGGNTTFVVQDTGKVGIGTASPSYPLSVIGASGSTDSLGLASVQASLQPYFETYDSTVGHGPNFYFRRSLGTTYGSHAMTTDTTLLGVVVARGDSGSAFTNAGYIGFYQEGVASTYTPTQIRFGTSNGTSTWAVRQTITAAGNVGIGTTTPAEKLYVVGNIYATGTITQGSSRELKEDINALSTKDALSAFSELVPVTYKYKADNEREHVGFIAEDVPDLVATKDRKGVNPMDIVAVLTKVVQEQRKTISELSEKLNQLESQVNRIKANNMIGRVVE